MLGTEKKKDKEIIKEEIIPQKHIGTVPSCGASILGPALHFKGDVTGNEDLVIEGVYTGKIDLPDNTLKIRPNAKIDGEFLAKNIQIQGKVNGNIHASGKVEIRNTASMVGDIHASRVSIEDGAQFKGSVKMKTQP
ncbi:MAG: polymer-forming cytoskeletal protein [Candidatus Aminicenantes bacterium]|nr:polymer-forming cytoskeletal protein [Candidatus Aminicenantes bacterium]